MVNKTGEYDDSNYIFNDKNERLEVVGDITLNIEYWDCECTNDYIHSNIESRCDKCEAMEEDRPNSRENEVREYFN
ncbi:MAG: hypothetical protein AUJ54_13385 [Ignavibacteria bacterium CG1_02_37_35]|nr:MAG: hypothetical protein AUJ54_13385 [Ignavibacteria bacterium CG1_02_37_35]